jgi:hypothetical protein
MKNLLLLLGCFISLSGFAQKLTYQVALDGKKHGQLTAVKGRVANDPTEHYHINSHFTFSLIATFDVQAQIHAQFRDSVVYATEAQNTLNGKPRDHTVIKAQTHGYLLTRLGEKPQVWLPKPVHLSIAKLYFCEPIGHHWVLSERFGELCPLKKVAAHTYAIQVPDGTQSRYHYRQGVCNLVETDCRFGKLTFTLVGQP